MDDSTSTAPSPPRRATPALCALRARLDPRVVVGAVYVVAMFMNILDSTIVNVALPTMARDFAVTTSSVEWVVTGYLLSLAVFIPASGWIGDRVGTKRIFLLALAVFTVASALCGLAGGLPELVVFRVLQGVGGGMLTPVGTAMLFRAFPPEQRARAASVLIIPTVVAPAAGPVIGGLLVDTLGWRWVFYVNVPIGLVALVFGAVFLVEHREPARGRFDVPGFVLSGAGLALALYAMSQGPARGWVSAPVLASAAVAAICFAILVPYELRRPDPMLRLSLLGDRLFATTNLVGAFAFASFLGVLFVLPLFLQEARGLSALNSGLTTFPEALGVVTASQVAARAYPRVGPRRLLAGGLGGVAVTMGLLAGVSLTTDLWLVRGVMFAMGAAMSFVFLSLQTATFARMSPADTGQASAIFNAQRQTATALGVAVLATVLTALQPGVVRVGAPADLRAFRAAFATAAVMAVAGAVVSLRVHDSDAAATMGRRTARWRAARWRAAPADRLERNGSATRPAGVSPSAPGDPP